MCQSFRLMAVFPERAAFPERFRRNFQKAEKRFFTKELMSTFSILSIGYDAPLLESRNNVLRSHGFRVAGARSRREAILLCGSGSFDLAMLCTSILPADADRLQRDLEIMNPGISVFNFSTWDEMGLPRDPGSLMKAVQAMSNRRNGQRSASEDGELQNMLRRAQQRIDQQQALNEFRQQLFAGLRQQPNGDSGKFVAGSNGNGQSADPGHGNGKKGPGSDGHAAQSEDHAGESDEHHD